MRARPILVLATIAFAGSTASAAAQSSDFHPPRFERTRLADDIYAFVFDNPLGPAVDGTAVVIINDDDVLVVDTQHSLWAARTVIAAIKELTSKPVRYVVNTHWHGDHHVGNLAYQQAYPGVEFIAHRHAATDIDSVSTPSLGRFAQRGAQVIADGEQRLREGKRADRSALTEGRGRPRASRLADVTCRRGALDSSLPAPALRRLRL